MQTQQAMSSFLSSFDILNSFVTILSVTNPIKTKKSRVTKESLEERFGFTDVKKVAIRYQNVLDYKARKQNLNKGKEITIQKREWKEKIGGCIYRHATSGYEFLQYHFDNTNCRKGKTIYIDENDNLISQADVDKMKTEFFAKSSGKNTDAEGGVIPLVNLMRLENIKLLKIAGNIFMTPDCEKYKIILDSSAGMKYISCED